MKRSILLSLCLAATLAVPAASHAQLLTPGGSPADSREGRRRFLAEVLGNVEVTVSQWREARRARDVEAVLRFYTDDAMLVPFRGEVMLGRDNLRDALNARLPVESEFRSAMVDFTAGGQMAYYAGQFSYLVTPRDGTEPYTASGMYVLLLEQARGGWKIRSHVERPDLDLLDAQRAQSAAATAAPAPATPSSPAPATAAPDSAASATPRP